ncbi:MAG: hypothetical protein ACI8P0_004345 [Planctomycetaceae bacterium]|jgi:hypothetical protein
MSAKKVVTKKAVKKKAAPKRKRVLPVVVKNAVP